MASLQQLTDDVLSYLDRRDSLSRVPSWITMVETELRQTLRARCQVVTAIQPIDSAYVTLPPDFSTMASIRDHTTGEQLILVDSWQHMGFADSAGCATAYRLQADCIEFLPHPVIPTDPTGWQPQQIEMSWYASPRPLLLPADSNPVLEQHYAVYLYGVLAHAGVFEQDAEMTSVWDTKYQQAVTRANLEKQQSDYSGAPYVQEMSGAFF